ncbi:MAG: hypothetical protein B6I20_09985 [Bacteroidetes bacterium 4572_117]|nr:MAG: hypothetical protein B6I20_09985 [Bacteroidetes bacterium 4572_117]
MKNLLITISLLLILPALSIAQNPSRVKPTKVVWLADGKELSISEAQKGVSLPTKLEISVILPNNQKLDGQKFEFKWYRRAVTRDYLTNSFIKKIDAAQVGGNQITLKAGRTNLKRGWWKVQIEAYADRKSLSFNNKQVFWIKLL